MQNVNGDDKMAIKWVMDNGFLPEDLVEQYPDCQIEFSKGNRTFKCRCKDSVKHNICRHTLFFFK